MNDELTALAKNWNLIGTKLGAQFTVAKKVNRKTAKRAKMWADRHQPEFQSIPSMIMDYAPLCHVHG